MGFCLFNTVAIATRVIAQKWNVTRILIVDWDVHHGNGTNEIFERSSQVLYISLHRWEQGNYYPGTGDPHNIGQDKGKGYSVNIGWNHTEMNDRDYAFAFEHVVMPIATEYNPELVLVSAGFDAAAGDEHGEMNLTPLIYAKMTQDLLQLANGKVVFVLEGGYNLESNRMCVKAVMEELLDIGSVNMPEDNEEPSTHCIEDVGKLLL
jgi:acetoin utilization deacetylase AcuC-like enzyme